MLVSCVRYLITAPRNFTSCNHTAQRFHRLLHACMPAFDVVSQRISSDDVQTSSYATLIWIELHFCNAPKGKIRHTKAPQTPKNRAHIWTKIHSKATHCTTGRQTINKTSAWRQHMASFLKPQASSYKEDLRKRKEISQEKMQLYY